MSVVTEKNPAPNMRKSNNSEEHHKPKIPDMISMLKKLYDFRIFCVWQFFSELQK